MSNPYSQPSLSGYNSSPPSDDGSQAATNQVEWAKHISKIGDPLKTYAAAVDANVLTAFSNIFGAGVLAKTASYTVTTSDRGRFITVTGASTITLPPAADAGTGFPIAIINIGSNFVTIDADSSETINGSVTQTLNPNESVILTCNGSAWTGIFVRDANNSRKSKSSSETVTSSTTLQNDDDLSGWNLTAGKTYLVRGVIFYSQSVGDLKYKFNFSQAPSATGALSRYVSDASGTEAVGSGSISTQVSITTMSDGQTSVLRLEGTFKANATTGGTLDFQWAQDTSSGNATTVSFGSWISVEQLD